jgi:hypothetical protein
MIELATSHPSASHVEGRTGSLIVSPLKMDRGRSRRMATPIPTAFVAIGWLLG